MPGRDRTPRRLVRCAGAALALAAGAGCAPPDRALEPAALAPRPNIVLVTLCSFRAARLGVEGYPRGLTPFLDRMAREGVYFENAAAASSWTKPAAATLLAGLTPEVHGLTDYYTSDDLVAGRVPSKRTLAEGVTTLPEALSAAGYRTLCRVNNLHAGDFFGLTQGCDDARTDPRQGTAAMLADFARWLAGTPAADRARPFFYHLFTRDAHTPYAPRYATYRRFARSAPPPAEADYRAFRLALDHRVRAALRAGRLPPATDQQAWNDLYDARLAELDEALGALPALLERAGAGATLIAVTADHGERFFEHGRIGHGGLLDEPVLRVPLLFWGAGVPTGRRVPDLVRSLDLYPTIAALAGAATPRELQGESLLPYFGDGEPPPSRTALAAFTGGQGVQRALRGGDRAGSWKLLALPGEPPRLYDLASDPGEVVDIAAKRPDRVRLMAEEMGRWQRRERALRARLGAAEERALSAETIAELKALGYLP